MDVATLRNRRHWKRLKRRMLRLKFDDKRIADYYYAASTIPGCMDCVDQFGILRHAYRYWGCCYGCVQKLSI